MTTQDPLVQGKTLVVSPTAEEDCTPNVEGYKNILDKPPAQSSRVVLYVGDSHGLRSILHNCGDQELTSNAHFWVPKIESAPLPAEDYEYLRAKGAFSLPPSDVCWELIETYFRFVHPMLPAVDPYAFLSAYERTGVRGISTLLLQSMFFTACNFIDLQVVQRTGVPSVKGLKKQFYRRAKALYDLDYETDRITLIQSTLLLGYWFGISYDRVDGWNWTSIAINMAQTMGLHRNPEGLALPKNQRTLWKRVWWSLFYRDRWTSLGMGRPKRISLADCDVAVINPADLASIHPGAGFSDKSQAVLHRCNSVALLFVQVTKLSVTLGEVMDCQYVVEGAAKLEKIRRCEAKLTEWYDKIDSYLRVDLYRPIEADLATSTLLYKYVLNLYFQVAVISLQKPLIYRAYSDVPPPEQAVIREKARIQSTAAAATAVEALRRIIDLDMIKWLPPESVTIINAVIGICFMEKSGSTGLKRQIATQNVELCVTILQALSERYWAASFFLNYFKAAFERIETVGRQSESIEYLHGQCSHPETALSKEDIEYAGVGSSVDASDLLFEAAPGEGGTERLEFGSLDFLSGFLEDQQQLEGWQFQHG